MINCPSRRESLSDSRLTLVNLLYSLLSVTSVGVEEGSTETDSFGSKSESFDLQSAKGRGLSSALSLSRATHLPHRFPT